MDTKTYAQALVDYVGISQEVSDYLEVAVIPADWTDQMFRTGVTQNYKHLVSKGSKELKRMFPLTIWVMKVHRKNSYERYSAKANIKISWLNGWMLLSI